MTEQAPDWVSGQSEHYLVVAPYAGPHEIAEYPTSRVIKASCGHLAWLSPQGEQYVAAGTIVCLHCAEPMLKNPDIPQIAAVGALEAIAAQAGDLAAWKVRAMMRRANIAENPTD